jgi:hypothetical protein
VIGTYLDVYDFEVVVTNVGSRDLQCRIGSRERDDVAGSA